MMPPQDSTKAKTAAHRFIAPLRQRRCQEAFRLREDFWIGLDGAAGPGQLRLPPIPARGGLLVARVPLSSRPGQQPAGLASLRAARLPLLDVDDDAPSVVVMMTFELLRNVLCDDLCSLPQAVRALLESPPRSGEPLCYPPTPEQLLAARSIKDCCLDGAVRNLYLKSKALELVASLLGQLDMLGGARVLADTSSARAEPFLRARDILAEDMENPPSLQELAVRVGMSETRLKRGFKGLFGLTPYGWLREQRLLEAQSLLLRPGASVSQVAYRVGYTNVSHFIAAFMRRFATRPGELLRAARQQELAF